MEPDLEKEAEKKVTAEEKGLPVVGTVVLVVEAGHSLVVGR